MSTPVDTRQQFYQEMAETFRPIYGDLGTRTFSNEELEALVVHFERLALGKGELRYCLQCSQIVKVDVND